MPRPPAPKPTEIVVSVEELLTNIMPTLDFLLDDVIMMLSRKHDQSSDFLITHKTKRYRIPIPSIEAYFKTHQKPERKMTVKEENEFLKKKLAEMERKYETVAPEKARAEKKKDPKDEVPAAMAFGNTAIEDEDEDEGPLEPEETVDQKKLGDILTNEVESKRPTAAKKTGRPKATAAKRK